MNDKQFKRHLKDMVEGHHHPEEHDWASAPRTTRTAAGKARASKRTRAAKSRKKT